MQYPVEVLNRAADIFRMAGHMLGERLLLFLLHHGLGVSFVDDGTQPFPLRRFASSELRRPPQDGGKTPLTLRADARAQ